MFITCLSRYELIIKKGTKNIVIENKVPYRIYGIDDLNLGYLHPGFTGDR